MTESELLGDVIGARLAAEPDVVLDHGDGGPADVVLTDTVPRPATSPGDPGGARLVVLAPSGDPRGAVEAARGGASAWLDGSGTADEFVRVLHGVVSGQAYFPPEVQGAVLRALRDDARPCAGPLARLTGREREVLDALAGGLGNREIGDHLGMSYNTVRTHINEIFRKLGVHSRVEAVRLLPAPTDGTYRDPPGGGARGAHGDATGS
ncbi:response regulator transcription factor [Actinomycetospora endophytica]|uniref:Response regulator transcription factor n=1 Tax=Actinomycetospora endophytica TaxID=2291215 RepID=A0ABS8PG08_9PSEU|nr:response regulator transcription factor [Actinomycetospora endophytica]MCD2195939.1 response regulator transcription factor [Actinomycetospora endophytica]